MGDYHVLIRFVSIEYTLKVGDQRFVCIKVRPGGNSTLVNKQIRANRALHNVIILPYSAGFSDSPWPTMSRATQVILP